MCMNALVLCADQVHDLAESWLTEAGLSVISTSTGQDAEKQLLEHPVDLLVLDTLPIYTPDLPSLRKLKDELPSLRVILIPHHDEQPEVGLARICGVDTCCFAL